MATNATIPGIRASELRGLRWKDVDLKKGEIHVRQRADRFNEIGKPKSAAGERIVPFGKFVADTLKEWTLAGACFGGRPFQLTLSDAAATRTHLARRLQGEFASGGSLTHHRSLKEEPEAPAVQPPFSRGFTCIESAKLPAGSG
jgi:integrase